MSTAQKYRKKPVVIEAMTWDGTASGATDVIDWMLSHGGTGRFHEGRPAHGASMTRAIPARILINTLEGMIAASPGDVVARGVQDEFYPCKPGIFAETYEAVRRVVPRTHENFPFMDTATSIRIGRFGEEGRYACAFGHVNRAAFAGAVNRGQDRANGEEALHADLVNWCWAVVEIDDSLPEDDGRTSIRWVGVTDDDEHSFPVTVLDTEA